MQTLQTLKFAKAINLVDANGTTATAIAVDCIGSAEVAILVPIGNIAADMTALKVTECDTSGGSYTDITGAAFTNPTASGSDNTYRVCFINRRNGSRKRYLKVTATAGAAATLIGAVALLASNEQTPDTDTERGVAESLTVN